MKTLEIKVASDGVLKLSSQFPLPLQARLAVLVLEPSEIHPESLGAGLISGLAEQSGAFDFLKNEAEIYSDADILPGRENPRFRK
ncbi:MAG TPA: hypothetical protein VK633_05530 [Verrucomicrobiae bacterium]|nr:hypothetical protein [Verrucomicrobiae bacterium]